MKSAIVGALPPWRQHFFRIVCGCPRDLLDEENFGKLFLSFFRRFLPGFQHVGSQNSNRMECPCALSMRSDSNNRVTIDVSQRGVEITSRECLRASASRLLFFANCFERPVLRRSVSDGWREIRFASDQIRIVKFSFERQVSRVTPHIAE